MKLQIKRIYDEPSEDDGKRIFVDRLWARGLTKEKARLDAWEKEIAPSAELRKWYGHDPEKFEEFRRRYLAELDSNPTAAGFAEKLKRESGSVTLLYGAKDGAHSNAAVLRDWLTAGQTMKIKGIDHLVITTRDPGACLHFYGNILGMRTDRSGGRYAVTFGNQKLNIHTRKAEFLPAAANPAYGSLDLCLEVSGDIRDIRRNIEAKGWPVEEGPVERHGARGQMDSIYLRDPDGNLIELCSYRS